MVLLNPEHAPQAVYTSLNHFLTEDDRSSKVVRIEGSPLPLDFRYIDRGSSNLTVFFTAAVPPDSLAPRFTGFGISKTLDANGLHFADPAVAATPEIFLAWYSGTRDQPLQDVLPRIISHYQGHGRTVLFGGSAGGFASMVTGHRLPESTAVAANPQTDLRRYNPALVGRWIRACWPVTGDGADLEQVAAVTNLVALYSQGCPNKVVYLQNAQDSTHVGPHFEPFMHTNRDNPNVRFTLGQWGEGHKAPPKDLIVRTLEMALAESWDSPQWQARGYRTASNYSSDEAR